MSQLLPNFLAAQHAITPGALELLNQKGIDPASLLHRHYACDWAELDAFDQQQNRWALRHGARILSRYTYEGDCFWIITEGDRSVTTILLPSEY
jgi:hypothetical protein